jgi:transposase
LVYHPKRRGEWLEQIADPGGRFRAEQLYTQLDATLDLRRRAKRSMLRRACNTRVYRLLQSVAGIGPVRAAEIMAIVGEPRRFRTKRQLWQYAGLGVITRSSGEWRMDATTGRIRRGGRPPLTRGLNPNFNRLLKKIFKSAAHDAVGRPGPLQDFYERMVDHGVRPEMAMLTIARKLAAIVLAVWKKGVSFDPRLIAQSV